MVKKVEGMNKYCCPNCGGELNYVQHKIVEFKQKISTKTGKLKYKPSQSDWDCDQYYGLECNDCAFVYNARTYQVENVNVDDEVAEKLFNKIENRR